MGWLRVDCVAVGVVGGRFCLFEGGGGDIVVVVVGRIVVWTVVVTKVVTMVMVVVIIMNIIVNRVSSRRMRERAATEADLDKGLQGGEAGAGDANGDFDGGPDERADVGPGDVRLIDVEDSPDANDGGAADAVGREDDVLVACMKAERTLKGERRGKREKEDVQSAHKEYRCQCDLLPNGKAETPDWSHGEDQDDDVKKNVRNGRSQERSVIVDAFAMWIRPDPCRFDGYALEDVGENDSDGPTYDDGEDNVASVFEGFADTEKTVVEE